MAKLEHSKKLQEKKENLCSKILNAKNKERLRSEHNEFDQEKCNEILLSFLKQKNTGG